MLQLSLLTLALCHQPGCTPDEAAASEEPAAAPDRLEHRIRDEISSLLSKEGPCANSSVHVEANDGFVLVTGRIGSWDCQCRVEEILKDKQGLKGFVLDVSAAPNRQAEDRVPPEEIDQGDMTRAVAKVFQEM